MTGFGDITLLDLDTIDLSNLNRQFLFRKKDVKQSKALVAAHTASAFNPHVRINPIHANIKDPQFDMSWFRTFDIVLNALDNLDARRHVNKMCMAAGVPLVESGTAGYLGQVQPILKDRTECFDCVTKQTPKTFPVCTIRSTPSQPIHCIVWAKSYLLSQLFGEDEDASGEAELNEALQQGENAQEIATLRKEAQAFRRVRTALRSPNDNEEAAKLAFEKVFHSDILNLLSMADMWKMRAPPVSLSFEGIKNGSFVLRGKPANATMPNGPVAAVNGQNGHDASTSSTGAGLKDQKALTLQDNLELFISSTNRLAARLQADEETISFDKDDDDTLDFVTAASNLRSAAYNIDGKTRWEVKEMAGNIIPAIATTNAIVSGLIVLQALQLLRKAYGTMKTVMIQYKPTNPLSSATLPPPNASCAVCRDTFTEVLCDPSKTTLGDVVQGILGEDEREVSVFEEKRILADPDWDENFERTLESLNVTRGKFLNIVDEDGELETISIGIGILPSNHPGDLPPFVLPRPLPQPPKRVKVKLPTTPLPSPAKATKRPAPDDGDIVEQQPAKRLKTSTNGNGSDLSSPRKSRQLEEDGLIVLDGSEDGQDDAEVIIVD
ncbi:hypothetical protein BDM02DRAFT_3107460 [Thelephora ganbajun]|uniref:Uncharacterized protein n=1 Tax=Thelephora ganbajun TaxID=370292 RepID=A0ACB6ZVC0_THEGA|nr:hypothetical protein BDM02DRAFT_3107460 [Thelephora ganbajun]